MPRFAHMSDIHVGAFRQPELRSLLLEAFEAAIDRCIAEKVEFVVMAGDIFDSNIPDLSAVSRAAGKMKEAADSGVRFYAIYGSHDFSPNFSSIVDVLDGAGLFTRAERREDSGGPLRLKFVVDPAGPKLCGVSGKKLSIDRDDYARLDREALEAEQGFKIFVFHGGIEELKPGSLEMMEAMPAASLPSGFAYYAGGHVHSRSISSLPGRENIAFPGPLFATDYSELASLAHGEERGFYLVDFDGERVTDVEFVPIKVCEVVEIRCSAGGKAAQQVNRELRDAAEGAQVEGKVVLLTVEGELGAGRTSDIDLSAVRGILLRSSPLSVLTNASKLTSRELRTAPASPEPVHAVELDLFRREITRVNTKEARLKGESGVTLAMDLLTAMKEEKRENESRAEFEDRKAAAGLKILGLGDK